MAYQSPYLYLKDFNNYDNRSVRRISAYDLLREHSSVAADCIALLVFDKYKDLKQHKVYNDRTGGFYIHDYVSAVEPNTESRVYLDIRGVFYNREDFMKDILEYERDVHDPGVQYEYLAIKDFDVTKKELSERLLDYECDDNQYASDLAAEYVMSHEDIYQFNKSDMIHSKLRFMRDRIDKIEKVKPEQEVQKDD